MVPVSSIVAIFYALVDILSKFMPIDEAECGYDKADIDENEVKRAQEAIVRDFRTERLIIKDTKKEREG